MRNYSLIIALLVSILMPVHVAANTLLSVLTCPAKEAAQPMTMDDEQQSIPDCCDEANGEMDCQQMPSCHGCSVSCQLASFSVPSYHVASLSDHPVFSVFFVASFDPGTIWRPPTNS